MSKQSGRTEINLQRSITSVVIKIYLFPKDSVKGKHRLEFLGNSPSIHSLLYMEFLTRLAHLSVFFSLALCPKQHYAFFNRVSFESALSDGDKAYQTFITL